MAKIMSENSRKWECYFRKLFNPLWQVSQVGGNVRGSMNVNQTISSNIMLTTLLCALVPAS